MKKLENQRVKESCDATFICVVNRNAAVVTWYKNDLKLRPSTKYIMTNELVTDGEQHTLVLRDMKPDDACTISAKATLKGYGQDKTTAKLDFSLEGQYRIQVNNDDS